jgi:hypothetical protein
MADYIRPTTRNPILGLLADAMMGGLAYMEDPRRTQQMRGVGGLLSDTGIAQTVERLAYGEPLTKGKGFATRMKPETAAAALTLGPEAVPIGRGARAAAKVAERAAMAAGRAGERYAERVVPQIMERGGLPAEMVAAMGQGTQSPLIVYHGSPYRFDRFDPTKIGSGEGAQAYGYGHYVAQAQDVAKGYQDTLSYKAFDLSPEAEKRGLSLSAGARGEFMRQVRSDASPEVLAKRLQNANISARELPQEKLADLFKAYKEQGGGSLYTIDLPDPAIARMLDWDKKFSEQPENVQRGILKYWSENPGLKYYGRPEQMTGEGIYGSVKAASLGPEGGARVNLNPANQAAAMDLRYQGIPGIRYLDQGSRGAGTGTSNFVVFPGEEDLLRILSVNGGLLSP